MEEDDIIHTQMQNGYNLQGSSAVAFKSDEKQNSGFS